MQPFLMLLVVPVLLLNFFGSIVSGIWLIVLGQWWALLIGVAVLFSPFVLGLAMAPGFALAVPTVGLLQRGKVLLAMPLILLSQAYTFAVVGGWCLFIYDVFMSRAAEATFWPLLIWSYGLALAPWMYLAQKDRQADAGEGSIVTTFFAQMAYLALMLAVILGASHMAGFLWFGGVMLAGLALQFALAWVRLKELRATT